MTLEKEVIEMAKAYAKEKGQSLSEMVENYFKLVTIDRRKIKPKELSPRIRRLRGIIKVTEKIDYKKTITLNYSLIQT